MAEKRYIRVRNWEKFQHYKKRRPVWIKCYVSILDEPEYQELTPFQRGMLFSLFLLAARLDNKIPYSPAYLMRALGVNVEAEYKEATGRSLDGDRTATGRAVDMVRKRFGRGLDTLIRLGWLEYCDIGEYPGYLASKELAENVQSASPEIEEEIENPLVPLTNEVAEVFSEWAQVTGHERCKLTADRSRKIKARLAEGYSVSDLKQVPHGSLKDPWEDRAKHNDVGVLFRNAQQVDKFIALYLSANGNGNGPMMASNQHVWKA